MSVDAIQAIETAFVKKADAIPTVRAALDYEPGQTRLPHMPCVTMLFLGATQRDHATGPLQEVVWQWNVYLYLGFADAKRAQTELKTIVPELLKIVRTDPTLDGSCEVAALVDELSVPELAPENEWIRKRLRLTAQLEHGA